MQGYFTEMYILGGGLPFGLYGYTLLTFSLLRHNFLKCFSVCNYRVVLALDIRSLLKTMPLKMIPIQKMALPCFEFKVLDQIICKQFKLNRYYCLIVLSYIKFRTEKKSWTQITLSPYVTEWCVINTLCLFCFYILTRWHHLLILLIAIYYTVATLFLRGLEILQPQMFKSLLKDS